MELPINLAFLSCLGRDSAGQISRRLGVGGEKLGRGSGKRRGRCKVQGGHWSVSPWGRHWRHRATNASA